MWWHETRGQMARKRSTKEKRKEKGCDETSSPTKRTNMILSVGGLALVLFAAVVGAATGSTDEYVAWTRHHNVLSWVHKAAPYPAFLLLRLHVEPTGQRAHPRRAGHEHVWFSS